MSASLLINVLSWLFCSVPLAPPSNDECTGAIEIAGEGEFSWSNIEATTSDIITECDDFDNLPVFGDPNFVADVWYCWTAWCTGLVTVDTCGNSAVDTKIGVYEGCGCSAEAFLTCSDNDCATQSILEFSAIAGAKYGIRIGSAPGVSGTTDSFHIACRPYETYVRQCAYQSHPAIYTPICKSRSGWDALNSTRTDFALVENFTPQETGLIRTACWAGAYLGQDGQECIRHSPDEFEITYYADDCGAPGAIIAGPFGGDHHGITVTGPAMTSVEFPGGAQEFEYGADHDPVAVAGGQTYWVAITNSSVEECGWYWETSPGNTGYAIQFNESNNSMAVVQNDFSFCFDVKHDDAPFCFSTSVSNDECESATPLYLGTVGFDTMAATTNDPFVGSLPWSQELEEEREGQDLDNDFPLGDHRLHKDIWFDLQYPCSGKARFSACDSSFDTKLAVLRGASCTSSEIIARSDDDCGLENLQSLIELPVLDIFHYKVNVSGYDGSWGEGQLHFQYVVPDSPTLRDFAALSRCYTGSCVPPCGTLGNQDCCDAQDFDADSDVDLRDASELLEALTGPQ